MQNLAIKKRTRVLQCDFTPSLKFSGKKSKKVAGRPEKRLSIFSKKKKKKFFLDVDEKISLVQKEIENEISLCYFFTLQIQICS